MMLSRGSTNYFVDNLYRSRAKEQGKVGDNLIKCAVPSNSFRFCHPCALSAPGSESQLACLYWWLFMTLI